MLVVAGASPAPSMSALVGAVEVPTQGCLCIVSYLCVALLECSACNMSFHVIHACAYVYANQLAPLLVKSVKHSVKCC